MKKYFTRSQRLTIVQGIQSIVLVIAICQLWLITATMNSYLGGDTGVPLPAAIFSLICFAFNLGLLKFLYGLDRPAPTQAEKAGISPEELQRTPGSQAPPQGPVSLR